jgi:hypothetical protein
MQLFCIVRDQVTKQESSRLSLANCERSRRGYVLVDALSAVHLFWEVVGDVDGLRNTNIWKLIL